MLYFSGKIFDPGGPSSGLKEALVSKNSKYIYFLANEYEAAKLRWVGGAQRLIWRGNAPKKTGARSARARTRGQNPLVIDNLMTRRGGAARDRDSLHWLQGV